MLYTPAQAAERLQVSKKTIFRRIADGSIKAIRLGNKTIRIEEADLQAFIDGKRVPDKP